MSMHAKGRVLGIATTLLILAIASVSAQTGILYRVKCGNEGFVDKSGHIWEGDAHYEGGQTFSADSAIMNTDIPYLYQSERWNDAVGGNLKYTFPVMTGNYKVVLHFAEIWNGAFTVGQRVFDVQINGTAVVQDLDVFAQAGADTPLILDYLSAAVDGKITVEFINKAGNAKIAGIEVLPQDPPRAIAAPYRIHCGGEDFIDPQGNHWEGDSHFSYGNNFVSANPVAGTDKSFLYQTERWNPGDQGDLAYSFDVAPGEYTVRLHFAEIFFTSAGQRVFDVDINGTNVIQSLDLAADPGPGTAVVKEFTAVAQEGKITVSLKNQIEHAKIAGIEILSGASTRARARLSAHADGFAFSAAAGVLNIRAKTGGAFTVTLTDLRGRKAAVLSGTGSVSAAGLRSGLYLAEATAPGYHACYRVAIP